MQPNTPRAIQQGIVQPNREALRAKLRAMGIDLDGNTLRRHGRKVQTLTDEQLEACTQAQVDADGNIIPEY